MGGARALVYIVDDEARIGRALERVLHAASCRARVFTSTTALLSDREACWRQEQEPELPGCIFLDLATSDCDAPKAQVALAASGCALPVICLSRHASIETCVAALRAGAVDFLLKPVDERRLLGALDRALAVDLQNRRAALCRQTVAQRVRMLTPREREVLGHLIHGRLNKQIAAEIGTVEKTVKVHRSRVMHKMGARSVVELVQLTHYAGMFGADSGNFVRQWLQRNNAVRSLRRS